MATPIKSLVISSLCTLQSPWSLANMATVARANLQKLEPSSISSNTMAAVARATLRGLSLPPGSWDSHVHVIDEVSHPFQQADVHC